jgi:adenylylsulfate kinase-like enzyme
MHQPYEPPIAPEVYVNTAEADVEECAEAVMAKLEELGYVSETARTKAGE